MYDILNEPLEIRLAKGKSKKTDPEILDILSHDHFWFVRNFVAANPSTTCETLHYLLEDDDFRVVFEADKNLKKRDLDYRITEAQNRKDLINSTVIHNIYLESADKEL